ncbi:MULTISPECIES: hypothetical protein [Flavobacterium]|uniref:Polyketide cyclase / dehydrase and lipid transport n=1 Tax=Flavobacterium jumunjinense TaxID=998845 RepID=A0ABV5GN74_9FLAO|nr:MULTISPECIES: hypothetical protein [Flavobacterium]
MRIAKYIILLLLLFTIAFTVFIATQPSEFNISQEKTISYSKAKLFDFISDYKNLENWHPKLNNQPTIKSKYSETTIGEGAFIKWEENSISTTKIFNQDSIFQIEKIDGEEYKTYWTFKEEKESTKITWGIKGTLSFREKIVALLKGKNNSSISTYLNTGLENINSFLVDEVNNFSVSLDGVITKQATNFIQQKDSCSIPEFQAKSEALLKNINTFVTDNGIQRNGDSFIMFKNWDESNDYVVYSVIVPIDEEILTTPLSDITGGFMEEFMAVKSTLKGDHKNRKYAWEKALTFFEKEENSDYIKDDTQPLIESYKVNRLTSKVKPSKFVTEVLIPVKKKFEKPVVVVKKPVEVPISDTINN